MHFPHTIFGDPALFILQPKDTQYYKSSFQDYQLSYSPTSTTYDIINYKAWIFASNRATCIWKNTYFPAEMENGMYYSSLNIKSNFVIYNSIQRFWSCY